MCALAACRSHRPAPPAAPAPLAGAADASQPLLTAAELDGYVRYQREMIGVYEQLFRDLDRVGSGARDAGPTGIPPAVRIVEVRARAEEEARRRSGLGEDELAWIEPMVLDVVSARALARTLDPQAEVAELKAMRQQVDGELREGLDQTIEDLQRQQDEASRLAEQRHKYGDANVDLVLTREAELTKNHDAWLSRLSGGRR